MTRISLSPSIRRWIPPREYLANTLVSRLPWVDLRVAGYARLGIRFESPRMSTILIGTEVHAPRSISIGSHSVVGRHCLLDGRGGLSIGRSVNISSYSLLITATHDAYDQDLSGSTAPIEIGDRAWIASGVKILAGVTIGEGAVVAAGAVVGTDVEPYTVVGGVPAKEIGRRPRSADDEAGYGALERGYRPNYI